MELQVTNVRIGEMAVVVDGAQTTEQVMAAAVVSYKGGTVEVGSGWTIEQRIRYAQHPKKLIGKWLTVQYFQETTNQTGGKSLRFPVVKFVHEKKRDL